MHNSLIVFSLLVLVAVNLAAGGAPAALVPSVTATLQPAPALYVLSRSGTVTRVSLSGDKQTIIQGAFPAAFQLANDRIYVGNYIRKSRRYQILVYSLDGALLQTVDIYPGGGFLNFATLPDGGFALLDNIGDKVYFTDAAGRLVATTKMLRQQDNQAQNVSAIVDNGSLILSEDGDKRVLTIDLATHMASIFSDLRSLPGAGLGQIAFSDGTYYLSTADTIYTISRTNRAKKIARLPKGNITGLVISGDVAYACVNFTGEIYKVNLGDGTISVFASGLDFPTGLGFSQ
ncbi:MAG: hypothetical protein JXA73_25955 [Acidobacteria bacterium]|nr:hypothetical protein [Acidobacteriota bacterium]